VLFAQTFVVPEGQGPQPLDRLVKTAQSLSWERARRAIETGKVSVDGERVTDRTRPVRPGASVVVDPRAPAKRHDSRGFALVYVDSFVVVVDKPPHVSTVPYADEPGTLWDLVRDELKRREHRTIPPLGVVHRLDKETSGLVVFSRTLVAKRHLKHQFRFHTTHRRYVALAHGSVKPGRIESRLVDDRGDGRRGSTENPRIGKPAVTHVRVLESLPGASLVECRLETGRTHQIRIHLAERGWPIFGERVYGRPAPERQNDASRLMLHARELGFVHPDSEEQLSFTAPLPADFEDELRKRRK